MFKEHGTALKASSHDQGMSVSFMFKKSVWGSFIHMLSCYYSNHIDSLEVDIVPQANSGNTKANFNCSGKISFSKVQLLNYRAITLFPCTGDNNLHYHVAYNNKFHCN